MPTAIMTYKGTTPSWSGSFFDFEPVTTEDMPAYDYTIVNCQCKVPVKIIDVGGESYTGVYATVKAGKYTSGIRFDKGPFVMEGNIDYFNLLDIGKTVWVTCTYTGFQGTDDQLATILNQINAVSVSIDYDSSTLDCEIAGDLQFSVEFEHTGTSACKPPTTVTAPSTVHFHGPLTVTWSQGIAGINSPISGYAVYRSTTQTGTYTRVGTTDANTLYYDDLDYDIGDVLYYKIKTLSSNTGYDSALSAPTNGTTGLERTTAPVIQSGTAGGVYNPNPRILITLGADAIDEPLTLVSEGYSQTRQQPMQGSKMVLRRIAATTPTTETVAVSNTDPSGQTYTATATVTVLATSWTDVPVVAGTTEVKAAHIMELRTALDNICDYYGMDRTDWGGDVVAGTTPSVLWPSHMQQIQQTARRIADFVFHWDYIDQENSIILPSFEKADRPSADAINQMRYIITLL